MSEVDESGVIIASVAVAEAQGRIRTDAVGEGAPGDIDDTVLSGSGEEETGEIGGVGAVDGATRADRPLAEGVGSAVAGDHGPFAVLHVEGACATDIDHAGARVRGHEAAQDAGSAAGDVQVAVTGGVVGEVVDVVRRPVARVIGSAAGLVVNGHGAGGVGPGKGEVVADAAAGA